MRLLVTGILVTGALSACGTPDPAAENLGDPVAYANEIVAATNAVREERGLDALVSDTCATSQALARATDQVAAGNLDHVSLDPVFDACEPYTRAAENLVDSDASPAEVVEAWMGSSGHRANILDPELTEIGVGCVTSHKGLLCTQIFLGRV